MKNIDIPIFAIDFEGSRKIGVVEYAAAEIFKGEIVAMHTSICSPKTTIPKKDAIFFDIDNNQASKYQPFSKSITKFCNMRKSGMFSAHNAIVEDGLLRDTLVSPSIVSDFSTNEQCATWSPWLDTLILVKNLYPQLESMKLSAVIESLNLKKQLDDLAKIWCPKNRSKWHTAPYDALACALITIHICRQDGFEDVDIKWLAKYSSPKKQETLELF